MIWVTKTRNEQPVCYAYINGITEQEIKGGGKITKYILGTSEKDREDETKKRYSSWFAVFGGQARKNVEANPLSKGDSIKIYSLKMTNESIKAADGTYKGPYLNVTVLDYDLNGVAPVSTDTEEDLAY